MKFTRTFANTIAVTSKAPRWATFALLVCALVMGAASSPALAQPELPDDISEVLPEDIEIAGGVLQDWKTGALLFTQCVQKDEEGKRCMGFKFAELIPSEAEGDSAMVLKYFNRDKVFDVFEMREVLQLVREEIREVTRHSDKTFFNWTKLTLKKIKEHPEQIFMLIVAFPADLIKDFGLYIPENVIRLRLRFGLNNAVRKLSKKEKVTGMVHSDYELLSTTFRKVANYPQFFE